MSKIEIFTFLQLQRYSNFITLSILVNNFLPLGKKLGRETKHLAPQTSNINKSIIQNSDSRRTFH